jgi:predicted lipoprotein with Yx(FWY)xxD motif
VARRLVVLSVVAGLALLAGCDAEPVASARVEPVAAPVVLARPVTLNVAEVAGLGNVLTTEDGHTLYLFTEDVTAPSTSTCAGECAQKWPPLMATGGITLTGAEQRLVGTLMRPDGGTQVTVGGWPLYTFAQDTAPGEAGGQGVQGVWFAVTPEGKKAGVPAPVDVRATDIPDFGPALTDGDGRTLYLFTLDSTEPSRSTCEGECARNWPPLLVTGEVTPTGVDPDLIGEVTRVDGTRQVTVGGWPVHTYTGDTSPGRTTGHGASGVWFVIEPAGCKSTAAVSEPPAARGPDGSAGY